MKLLYWPVEGLEDGNSFYAVGCPCQNLKFTSIQPFFSGCSYQHGESFSRLHAEIEHEAPKANGEMMKAYRKELWFEVQTRRAFINITPQIEKALQESGIAEGLVLANAMHISASVFINDDESGLHADLEKWLEKLAPEKPHGQYAHNRGEDNADAHLKRTIMGREVIVAVSNGKLDFGPWEQIFYGEFDGKRRKRVLVKIIGE